MISIITPTNNPKWLNIAHKGLLSQTFEDWEWIIVLNHPENEDIIRPDFEDKRIKILDDNEDCGNIGALKHFAALHSTGDIILELDHDDLLTPDCLEKVNKTFKSNPDATMVYSNSISVDIKTKVQTRIYNGSGWEYTDGKVMGKSYKIPKLPILTPQNFSRIWFAPNHVRAWRAKSYWRIDGHDVTLKLADDHDLTIRNYLEGKIVGIDEVLYIQHSHENNTSGMESKVFQDIQNMQWANYNKYILDMAEKWSADNGLINVDLCGAINPYKDYITYDLHDANIIGDLNDTWKLEDNSVGILRANDALEHMVDPIHAMNEAWRVLAHGGFFFIAVPSTDGRGAFQDPTHKSFWNSNSFFYYTNPDTRKYIEPACHCKFQTIKMSNEFPNPFCKQHEIVYTYAHLIAIKDGSVFHGDNKWHNINELSDNDILDISVSQKKRKCKPIPLKIVKTPRKSKK